jgi:large subunit ribosomal protein L32
MALPKRRHSKARGRKRRTHQKLRMPAWTTCSQCGAGRLAHNACRACGYYKGRLVLSLPEKKREGEGEEERK